MLPGLVLLIFVGFIIYSEINIKDFQVKVPEELIIIFIVLSIILISVCFAFDVTNFLWYFLICSIIIISYFIFKDKIFNLIFSMKKGFTMEFNPYLRQIKKINKKIQELRDSIDLLPNSEEFKEIKDLKAKTMEKLKQEQKLLVNSFIKSKFPFVYVIIHEVDRKKITKDIEDAYKIVAEKYFNLDKIKFLSENELNEKIEKITKKITDIIYPVFVDDKIIKIISTKSKLENENNLFDIKYV